MKKIITSLLFLCTISMTFSQTSKTERDSVSVSKVKITAFEFGFNAGLGGDGIDGGLGTGFYFEPKYEVKEISEFGLLIAYNRFTQLNFSDYPNHRHRDHYVGQLFVTAKKSGASFFGLYGGVGAGLFLAKIGGRYDHYFPGQLETQDSLILRPGVLLDTGFHIGALNLGFKFILGGYGIAVLNLGIKL